MDYPDRSAFPLRWKGRCLLSQGTEKRGSAAFLTSWCIFSASWRIWSLLWRRRCWEPEEVRPNAELSKKEHWCGLSAILWSAVVSVICIFFQHCKLTFLTSVLPLLSVPLPPLLPLMLVSSFPLLYIWPFHYAGISTSLINMWNRYADDLICWVF